jgi:hypothetical protein
MTAMSIQTTLRPVRKLALVLAVAGVTGLGTVAAAPAALADEGGPVAQDGSAYVVEGNGNGNGPDYFLVTEDGKRIPIFFCDRENPHKQHNICIPDPSNGPRF